MTPGPKDLWFLPLGGCGEIGMNLNLFGHAGQWLMVDCGITFERGEDPTKTYIEVPDPSFIAKRRDALAGIIITHAHEDHLGALPLLWDRFPAPVYTTPFTAEVLRRKAAGRGGRVPTPIIECLPGETLSLGPFTVDLLPITHSTAETCALHIRTSAGSVLHTADWKIDPGPVVGPAFDEKPFEAIGAKGVDAVVCDSTNATVAGFSTSERTVARGLRDTVKGCTGRVVVACFASNVARLKSVAQVAESTGRYLGLLGRSLEQFSGAALRTGLLERSARHIETSHLGYLPPEEVLAIATGSQGEYRAALHRLATDTHPQLNLEAGDTVIFSSRVIPGNERSVQQLVSRFQARGIRVIQSDDVEAPVHASGHPCAEELARMYRWLKPRVAVPVHGEEHHMNANGTIAKNNGAQLALTGLNGDLFYLAPHPGARRRVAEVGRLVLADDGSLIPKSAQGMGPAPGKAAHR